MDRLLEELDQVSVDLDKLSLKINGVEREICDIYNKIRLLRHRVKAELDALRETKL